MSPSLTPMNLSMRMTVPAGMMHPRNREILYVHSIQSQTRGWILIPLIRADEAATP